MRAAAATRALSVVGRPKMLREMPRPLYISHRIGGSTGYGPYPENTAESMEFLLADGGRAMNYDGLSITSDGVIVNEHDTTVDRTKNGTGTISAMTLAAYKALKQAPSLSWGPGFPDNTWATHTFDEMVAQLGARAVHHPECNVAGQAAFYAACFVGRGLNDYVQVETGSLTIANALVAAGIPATYLLPDATTVATAQSQWAVSQGPVGVNYYQASPPGGSIDAYIQALVTAGYRVQVFSINRKGDATSAIASAAAAGGVLDGVISNDPIYMDTRIWKPRTTDSFSTGRYGHGLISGAGGTIPRGVFTGTTPNRFGFTSALPATGVQVLFNLGEISPLPSNCTVTWTVTIDGVSSAATAYAAVLLHATSDLNYTSTGRPGGYYVRLNQGGSLQLYRSAVSTGALTQLGATQGGGNPSLTNGQQITLRLTTTATQVILTRLDTGDTVTVNDTTFRGGYAQFGKTGGAAVAFTDGVLTSGSAVVTSATAAFNAATDVGKLITGTGIPANTAILSVQSTTQATMSANATASGNPVTINVSRPNIYCTYSSIGVT